MKYLINTTDVYRVETVEDAERLHEELKNDSTFTLVSFGYKTKYNKKTEEEYQLVTAKKIFNEEKDPSRTIEISYEVY